MRDSNRIQGFDVARAFAIMGMMLVNYKIVFTYGIKKHMLLSGFLGVFEGRAVAVFIILAGIGIGLMTKKSYFSGSLEVRKQIRITVLKRALFLFVLGQILYAGFGWSADILHYYGVFMVMICFFIYD